jgi:hypothetical protein
MDHAMTRHAGVRRGATVAAVAATLLGVNILLATKGAGQSPGSGVPVLPGGVARAPDWLKSGAPFDVAKFLAPPPAERNAATPYLVALLEFVPELAEILPPGTERDRRRAAVKERLDRFMPEYEAFGQNADALPDDRLDEAIKPFEEGFHKIILAQRRPECMFVTAIDASTPLPHVQGTRTVIRVAQLRIARDLRRGDVNAAIDDVATCLHLSRDLRRRGVLIAQLVSISLESFVEITIMPGILASPDLQAKDCDRLLQVLQEHEAKGLDRRRESLKAEYVLARSMVRDLSGRNAEVAGPRLAELRRTTAAALLTDFETGQAAKPEDLEQFVKQVGRVSAKDYQAVNEALGHCFKVLDGLMDRPFAERIARAERYDREQPADRLATRFVHDLVEHSVNLDRLVTRNLAQHRGTACLVALRRAEVAGGSAPGSLAEAARAAKLPGVPIDPFDGQPLRLTRVDGRPVVYSIGKDGRDDRGLINSRMDSVPGDLVLRLPEVAARRARTPASAGPRRVGSR